MTETKGVVTPGPAPLDAACVAFQKEITVLRMRVWLTRSHKDFLGMNPVDLEFTYWYNGGHTGIELFNRDVLVVRDGELTLRCKASPPRAQVPLKRESFELDEGEEPPPGGVHVRRPSETKEIERGACRLYWTRDELDAVPAKLRPVVVKLVIDTIDYEAFTAARERTKTLVHPELTYNWWDAEHGNMSMTTPAKFEWSSAIVESQFVTNTRSINVTLDPRQTWGGFVRWASKTYGCTGEFWYGDTKGAVQIDAAWPLVNGLRTGMVIKGRAAVGP